MSSATSQVELDDLAEVVESKLPVNALVANVLGSNHLRRSPSLDYGVVDLLVEVLLANPLGLDNHDRSWM